MGRMGFYFDAVNCIGCRTCQIACKDKNALPVGMLFRRVVTVEAGRFPEGSFFHISEGCNHCEDPACVSNCPSGACAKNEQGLVTIDEEVCIGCRSCVMSCPYGQPQYDALNSEFFFKSTGTRVYKQRRVRLASGGQHRNLRHQAFAMKSAQIVQIAELQAAHQARIDTDGVPSSGS